MKKILFLIILLIAANGIAAQDIITRKDGSETKAKVTEIGAKDIKYKRFDNLKGPEYTEPREKILKIKYENGTEDYFTPQKNTPKAEKIIPKLINPNKNVRYAGIVETGFAVGMQTKKTKLGMDYTATFTQGVSINEKHFVGIGVGFEAEGYIDGNGPYGYIPVYANYRHTFKDAQISPFMSVSAGYRAAVTKTSEINGGLWSNISVGVQFGKLLASLGTFAKMYSHNNVPNNDNYANLGVMFNVGIRF